MNFYLENNGSFNDVSIEGVLVGSAALAVHMNRHGTNYETDTKDVDIYTNEDLSDLQFLESLPLSKRSRSKGAQYCYDLKAASTAVSPPEVFIDVITDYELAFEWEESYARVIERIMSEEAQWNDNILTQGVLTVHLPDLRTLRKTYEDSNRDYKDRIELIDDLIE